MEEETQTNQGKEGGKWFALLVGVNRYEMTIGLSTLEGCVNDVKGLEKILKRLDYCEIVCLHDGAGDDYAPTKDNVEAQLADLTKFMGENDTLFVHFSCHGVLHQKQPMLILKGTRLEHQGLPVPLLREWMGNTGAKKLILSLDACYSGAAIGRGGEDSKGFIKNVYENSDGFVTIASSRGQQRSQELKESPEYPGEKYGLYTYYLIDGLKGAAIRRGQDFVTTDEIYDYILDKLREECKRTPGITQDPVYGKEGCGQIILADYHSKSSLILKLEPNLYQIDYHTAKDEIDTIVGRLRRGSGAALFLLQNEKRVRGDLCLRYLENRLKDELGVQKREYPIGALDMGGGEVEAFTCKLAEHLELDVHRQQSDLLNILVDEICQQAIDSSYCIISVRIKGGEQPSPFLKWFLGCFWGVLVDRLEKIQQDGESATVVGILSTDEYLAEQQVSEISYVNGSENCKKFLDLPIFPWTEKDISKWLQAYATPTLTRDECVRIADAVYQDTEGIPEDTWIKLEEIIQNLGRQQNRESA
jgi:Caspase domain